MDIRQADARLDGMAMSKMACRLCIIVKGPKGSELAHLPDEGDHDGFARHLILVHGLKVEGYDPKTGLPCKPQEPA